MPGSDPALERDALVALTLAEGDEWIAMREVYEPKLFRLPQHRAAAEAIGELRNGSGKPVEPRSVAALLERAGNVAAARTFQNVIRRGRAIGDGVAVMRLLAAEAQRYRAGILDAVAIFAPLPPVRWLCQGLDLAPGAPALFAGYGYSGKTVAAQEFALAVATGTPAWGRFPVRQGRVLHVDYEQGSYLTRLRYQRLARARGAGLRELGGRLEVEPLPPWYLDAGDAYEQLVRRCEGLDLVIVDSFRAACPHTDENSSDARVPLDVLGRVSEATGAVAVALHHARKPTKDDRGGAKTSIRGSGALFDACGTVLVFASEKGKAATVSQEKARITGRPAADFGLWIEDVEVDGDPVGGLRVSAIDADADGSPKKSDEEKFAAMKTKLLEILRREGAIVGSLDSIQARVKARRVDVRAALNELVLAGLVQRSGSYHQPRFTAVGSELPLGTDPAR